MIFSGYDDRILRACALRMTVDILSVILRNGVENEKGRLIE